MGAILNRPPPAYGGSAPSAGGAPSAPSEFGPALTAIIQGATQRMPSAVGGGSGNIVGQPMASPAMMNGQSMSIPNFGGGGYGMGGGGGKQMMQGK